VLTTPVVLPGRMYERMTPSLPPTVGRPGWYCGGRPTALPFVVSTMTARARGDETAWLPLLAAP
jgi:hypothetical protein